MDISVVIPLWNEDESLRELYDWIERVMKENGFTYEVIFANDGSTDNSLDILNEYAEKDSRIRVITITNGGVSNARNVGIESSSGEFIAFVDADDTIEPDWCARHLAAIEGVDYVQSGYKRIYHGDTAHARSRTPLHPYIYTSPCMRLYRTEAIANLRFTEGVIYEDVRWSVRIWAKGLKCRMINYAGYHYTANPHSTTSQRHPEAHKQVIQDLYKMLPDASLRAKLIILYTIIRMKIHYLRS